MLVSGKDAHPVRRVHEPNAYSIHTGQIGREGHRRSAAAAMSARYRTVGLRSARITVMATLTLAISRDWSCGTPNGWARSECSTVCAVVPAGFTCPYEQTR